MSHNEIHVLRGHPSDEELAALVVALAAVRHHGGSTGEDHGRPRPAGGWQRHATGRTDPRYRLMTRGTS